MKLTNTLTLSLAFAADTVCAAALKARHCTHPTHMPLAPY